MSYTCKFDDICKKTGKYNAADTLPVTITFALDGKPKTIQKSNPCTHGGGCSCRRWRHYTDTEIGWYNPLPNRSINRKRRTA